MITWLALIPLYMWFVVPVVLEFRRWVRDNRRTARIVQEAHDRLEADRTARLMRWAYSEVGKTDDRVASTLPAADRLRIGCDGGEGDPSFGLGQRPQSHSTGDV